MEPENQIYKKIAAKNNLSVADVTLMCRSLGDFTHTVMEAGNLRAVRWPHFGIFMCKPTRITHLVDKGLLTLNSNKDD